MKKAFQGSFMTHTESVLGLRSIWVDGVFKHDLEAEHKKTLIKRKDVAYRS